MPTTPETDTLGFEQPQWKRITPARSPAAREDHTWTVDAERRFAYLFGGRDGSKDFDDLWRFDLEQDSWKKLSPAGATPEARFGHSAVWVDGLGLVVFAGQKGVEFFGDLWVFDPDRDKWKELPANGAAPKRRYGSCMIVGPDGRIWISHGFTFSGRFDDTRAYNLKTSRWASIAPDGRRPGERCLHDCFTSSTGQLVLYGGQDNSERALGDLWVTRPNGSWKKAAAPQASARRLYAVTEAGAYAYVFGGAGKDDRAFDDLWRVDRDTLEFERVRVDGPTPGARYAGTLITDPVRGRLLLFGGQGNDAMSDMWELTDVVSLGDNDEQAAESTGLDPDPAASDPPDPEAAAIPELAA
jgi:N-acetylneuraminic acid mutarotase